MVVPGDADVGGAAVAAGRRRSAPAGGAAGAAARPVVPVLPGRCRRCPAPGRPGGAAAGRAGAATGRAAGVLRRSYRCRWRDPPVEPSPPVLPTRAAVAEAGPGRRPAGAASRRPGPARRQDEEQAGGQGDRRRATQLAVHGGSPSGLHLGCRSAPRVSAVLDHRCGVRSGTRTRRTAGQTAAGQRGPCAPPEASQVSSADPHRRHRQRPHEAGPRVVRPEVDEPRGDRLGDGQLEARRTAPASRPAAQARPATSGPAGGPGSDLPLEVAGEPGEGLDHGLHRRTARRAALSRFSTISRSHGTLKPSATAVSLASKYRKKVARPTSAAAAISSIVVACQPPLGAPAGLPRRRCAGAWHARLRSRRPGSAAVI